MLNRVILIGRLVRDPEMRYTPSGIASVRMSIAVQRPFANQQGERETDFIDVTCWRQLAENVSQHLQKGRLVAVQGSLHIRKYETADGQQRRAAEVSADQVRFLDRPRDGAPGAGPAGFRPESPEGEDDVPF